MGKRHLQQDHSSYQSCRVTHVPSTWATRIRVGAIFSAISPLSPRSQDRLPPSLAHLFFKWAKRTTATLSFHSITLLAQRPLPTFGRKGPLFAFTVANIHYVKSARGPLRTFGSKVNAAVQLPPNGHSGHRAAWFDDPKSAEWKSLPSLRLAHCQNRRAKAPRVAGHRDSFYVCPLLRSFAENLHKRRLHHAALIRGLAFARNELGDLVVSSFTNRHGITRPTALRTHRPLKDHLRVLRV